MGKGVLRCPEKGAGADLEKDLLLRKRSNSGPYCCHLFLCFPNDLLSPLLQAEQLAEPEKLRTDLGKGGRLWKQLHPQAEFLKLFELDGEVRPVARIRSGRRLRIFSMETCITEPTFSLALAASGRTQ